MPNPRVTVILSSELVTLINAELERNPWSEGPTVIRKPRSMSEVITSAAMRGLSSDSPTVGLSEGRTVRVSDSRTVGPSDDGWEVLARSWVVSLRYTDRFGAYEGETAEDLRRALGDLLSAWNTELGGWTTIALEALGKERVDSKGLDLQGVFRTKLLGVSRELDATVDRCMEWVSWAWNLTPGDPEGPVPSDKVLQEGLGERLKSWREWQVWATERLGLNVMPETMGVEEYPEPTERDSKGLREMLDRRFEDLKEKVVDQELNLFTHEEYQAALERGSLQVDPRLKDTPEWLTPERAISCLLDVVSNPEAMAKLEVGSRKRHPEWFKE